MHTFVIFVRRGTSEILTSLFDQGFDIAINSSNMHVHDIFKSLDNNPRYNYAFAKNSSIRARPTVTYTDPSKGALKSFASMNESNAQRPRLFVVEDQPERWRQDEDATIVSVDPFDMRALLFKETSLTAHNKNIVDETVELFNAKKRILSYKNER
jgi:hypothetical protein